MRESTAKLAKVGVILAVLGGLYALAEVKHADRAELRRAGVDLTPACKQKLEEYGLIKGDRYRSPYSVRITGSRARRASSVASSGISPLLCTCTRSARARGAASARQTRAVAVREPSRRPRSTNPPRRRRIQVTGPASRVPPT